MAAAAFSYRSQDKSSDSDSENSDIDSKDWKRATARVKDENLEKIPIIPPAVLPMQEEKLGLPNRKRNNIWCEVLEDQMMSETLNHCGIKNKPKGYGSRGEESYDYTLSYKHFKKDDDSDKMSEDEMSDSSKSSSVTSFKSKRFQSSKFVKLDGPGVKAAKKIIQILGEKKHYLIFRVVKYIGIGKAMQLLKETEKIEESGGMLIKNQQRRRTPGGVYFQLLKVDKDIKKAAIDQIFENELNSYEVKKRADGRKKKKLCDAKKKLLKEIEEKFEDKQEQSKREKDDNLVVMEDGEVEVPPVQNVPVSPNTKDSDLEEGEIDD